MATPQPESIKERVAKLVERGLVSYGAGNLQAAISEWEHALALDPDNAAVAAYVQYVKDNFDGLDEAFRTARAAADAAISAGVPLGQPPSAGPSDERAYADLEIVEPHTDRVSPPPPPPLPERSGELDTGWEIDALAAPLPPPPLGLELDKQDLAMTPIFGTPALAKPPAGDESFPLAELAPAPHAMKIELDRQDQEDAQTTSRPWPNSSEFHDVGTDEYTNIRLGEADLMEVDRRPEDTGTGERTSSRSFGGNAEESTAHRTWSRGSGASPPSLEPKPGGEPSVTVDDDLLLGLGESLPPLSSTGPAVEPPSLAGDDPEPSTDIRAAPGSSEETLRTRILSLIHQAENAAESGDLRLAVEVLEQVMSADPETTVVQVTLHRHRDLILKIYETCLGEPTEVPVIAIPVSDLGSQDLDHRAAFLLSRIDGTLTFEEILDIAGMPRLEAYRLLAGLVRRGILEFRQ